MKQSTGEYVYGSNCFDGRYATIMFTSDIYKARIIKSLTSAKRNLTRIRKYSCDENIDLAMDFGIYPLRYRIGVKVDY